MRPKVGIPRGLGYYYMYPFYKTFLEQLGAEVVVSPPTTKATLDLMDVCPTDEPCVAVKLFFAHTQVLADMGVDFIWSPVLVSLTGDNYCCPKFLGIADMVRNGLRLENSEILMPRFDHRLKASEAEKPFFEVAARLGVTDKGQIHRALGAAYNAQGTAERAMVEHGLTIPRVFDGLDNPSSLRQADARSFLSAISDPMPRIGVIGHPYLLYDMLGHNMIERLGEFGRVITAEMVSKDDVETAMKSIFEGYRLWYFEARMLGAALHLIRNHLVEKLVLVGSFECGPESIIESYIEDEAEKQGIPFLLLTIDEQTGEAGLVTRIEAFIDTSLSHRPQVHDVSHLSGRKSGSTSDDTACRMVAECFDASDDLRCSSHSAQGKEMVVGFPSMGYLDIAIRAMLEACGTPCIVNPRTNKRAIELGAELAPEFVCFPLTATLGQMRVLLDKGANTIFMVNGKGRCRLGWYGQVQENLLRKAGYEFEMITLDSPVPLRSNWKPFRDTLKRLAGNAPWPRILSAFWFGYQKLLALDRAESICHKIRAVERERGEVDVLFSKFVRRMDRAIDMASVKQEFSEFEEAVREIEIEDTHPLKVRIVGEIWVVLERFVNQEIEKMLASQDVRVEVDREMSASQWFRQNVLNDRRLQAREQQLCRAALPYLTEEVGGHGLESVGASVLAREEGCDGVLHIFPFTCMPEIIAQNILVKVGEDMDLPILTFIVSEQTGEAGFQTRVEAFLDILEERRHGTRSSRRRTMAKSA